MQKGPDQAAYGKMLSAAQGYVSDARIPKDQAAKWIAQLKQSGVILAYRRTDPIPVPAGKSPFAAMFPPEETPAGPFKPFTVGDSSFDWKPVESKDAKGIVVLEMPANTDEYLTTTYDAPAAGWALLTCSSDDGLTVWLNGKKVNAQDVDRGCIADVDKVAVQVNPGTNVLLLKVDNHAGPAGVQARMRRQVNELDLEELTVAQTKIPGDVEKGKALFTSLGCVKCHTVDRHDDPKGPFLGDAGTRLEPKYILESIRKPSAKIAQGYETVRVVAASDSAASGSDTEYLGFVTKETAEELLIRDATGRVSTVAKAKIRSRTTMPGSIMPEGLTDALSLEDFSCLVSYLRSMKTAGAVAAGK
jgi:putative heme-binding domain-containing protein